MSERLSKKSLAKLLFGRIIRFCDKNKYDYMSGTHQFLKLFNDRLIKSINDLKCNEETEEGWNKVCVAEKAIYDLMDKLIEYGKKEECKTIIDIYDLNNIKIEE
jgi:hypothetical protein